MRATNIGGQVIRKEKYARQGVFTVRGSRVKTSKKKGYHLDNEAKT